MERLRATAHDWPLTPSGVLRLREQYGPERSRLLLDFAPQLFAAEKKLDAANVLATRIALQQASDHWLAAYKRDLFPVELPVVDVCAGIGGDSIALARRGPVIAIDQDPLVCRCLEHNARRQGVSNLTVKCCAAETCIISPDACLHIDPDRRVDAKRQVDPERYSPNVATVSKLLAQSQFAAVKLAPVADLPEAWRDQYDCLEWLSRDGECRQQIAWFDRRQPPRFLKRATRVDHDGTYVSLAAPTDIVAQQTAETTSDIGQWLYDWDPAIRAASLSDFAGTELGAAAIGDAAGFFTSDSPPPASLSWRKMISLFRVRWSGPLDRKQLRKLLQDNPPRALEIKVRGVNVLPETLRKEIFPKHRDIHSPFTENSLDQQPATVSTLLIGRAGGGYSPRQTRAGQHFAALADRINLF
jgi:hypothetical protein